jgi:hypothetical protein
MPGYVYAISNPSINLIKIGLTRNPKTRIRGIELTSGSHVDIVGVVQVQDPSKIESLIHDAFGDCKVIGEWFRCSPEDAEGALRKICSADLRRRTWGHKRYFRKAKIVKKRSEVNKLEKL